MRKLNYFKRAFFILMALCITSVAFGQSSLIYENLSTNSSASYGLEGPVAGKNYSAKTLNGAAASGYKGGTHPLILMDDITIPEGHVWEIDSIIVASASGDQPGQKVFLQVAEQTTGTPIVGDENWTQYTAKAITYWTTTYGDLTTDVLDKVYPVNITKEYKDDLGVLQSVSLLKYKLVPATDLTLQTGTHWFQFYSDMDFKIVAPSVEAIGDLENTGNGLKRIKTNFKMLNDPWNSTDAYGTSNKSWQGLWFEVHGTLYGPPSEVTALTVVPAANESAKTAKVSWVNPTEDVGGNPIEGAMDIIIKANDVVIETLTDVTLGATVNDHEITLDNSQEYTISVVARSARGENNGADQVVYVGDKKPVAATNFTAMAGADEAHFASLIWENPTVNAYDGLDLVHLDTVFVEADGTIVDTLTGADATIGATINYTFNVEVSKEYSLKIITRNDGGQSKTAAQVLWIGAKKPLNATDLSVVGSADSYEATLRWQNPDMDIEGKELKELYSVFVLANGIIIDTLENPVIGGKVTDFVTTVNLPGDYTFTVKAGNSAGKSTISNEATVWVGPRESNPVMDDIVLEQLWYGDSIGINNTHIHYFNDGNKPFSSGYFDISKSRNYWYGDKFTVENESDYVVSSVDSISVYVAMPGKDTIKVVENGIDQYYVSAVDTTENPFSEAYLRILSSDPKLSGTATEFPHTGQGKAFDQADVIWGDTKTNVLENVEWTSAYHRYNDTINLPIYKLTLVSENLNLPNGDYWFDYTVEDTVTGFVGWQIPLANPEYTTTGYASCYPRKSTNLTYWGFWIWQNKVGFGLPYNVYFNEETTVKQVPLAAENFEVTTSTLSNEVVLDWTNPSVGIFGFELSKLDAYIYVDGEVKARLFNIETGGNTSHTIELESQGYYEFSIALFAHEFGAEVNAGTFWVGSKDAVANLPNVDFNFGTTGVNLQQINKIVTINNTGLDTLTFESLTALNGHDAFTSTFNAAAKVAPGDVYKFTITFLPTAAGALTEELTLVSKSGDDYLPQQTITLAGEGVLDKNLWSWKNIDNPYLGTGFNATGFIRSTLSFGYDQNGYPVYPSAYAKADATTVADYIITEKLLPTADFNYIEFDLMYYGVFREFWPPYATHFGVVNVKVEVCEFKDFTSGTVTQLYNNQFTSADYTKTENITVDLSAYEGQQVYIKISVDEDATTNSNVNTIVGIKDLINAPFYRFNNPIDITVTDAVTGDPIEDVVFTFDNGYFLSDENGKIDKPDYFNTFYRYSFSKEGYSGGKTWQLLNLPKALGVKALTLTKIGHVTYAINDDNGNPFENVKVTFGDKEAFTDATGLVTFSAYDLEFGKSYDYEISFAGCETISGTQVVNGDVNKIFSLMKLYDFAFNVTNNGAQPVLDANIDFAGAELKTSFNGVYTFAQVSGTHSYEVSAMGYESSTGTVDMTTALSEDVVLTNLLYDVYFNLVDENGVTLANADIVIDGVTETTNADGQVVFAGLTVGNYNYTCELAGFMPLSGTVAVTDWDVIVSLETETVYTIQFKVWDGTNNHNGALVQFNGEEKTTDADGLVSFTNVPVLKLPYNVSKVGYLSYHDEVTVAGDELVTVVLDQPANVVSFTITDGTNPLSDVLVAMNNETRTTAADGIAIFTVLDGDHNYTITKYGYDTETGNVTVTAGNDVNVPEITMSLTVYSVDFIVSDENGKVENASIVIDGKTLTTDTEGKANVDLNLIDGVHNSVKSVTSLFDYTISTAEHHTKTGTVDIASGNQTENVTIDLVKYDAVFTVTDGEQTIEAAVVTIDGVDVSTHSDGTATFNLVPGSYSYVVSAAGYLGNSGTITIVDVEVAEAVELDLEEYAVKFTVTDGETVIEEATVTLTGDKTYVLTTNENGVAEGNVVPGEYDYSVAKTGYKVTEASISVVDEAVEANVEIELIVYTVTFVVSNENGFVNNATISINETELTTDANGEAQFTGEPQGYDFAVTESAHHDYSGLVSLIKDTTLAVNLDLVKHYVFFELNDENGVLVGDSIFIQNDTLISDKLGMDSIYLVPGTYDYTVKVDNKHELVNANVTIVDTNVVEKVNVPLVRHYAVFTVTNDFDLPVIGAKVSINDGAFELTTDSTGMDSVDLLPGDYKYTITAADHYQNSGVFSIVLNGNDVYVEQELKAETFTVTFNVTNGTNAIEGAGVTVAGATVTTDDKGKARFNLPSATFTYSITKTNFHDVSGEITVASASIIENVEMELSVPTVEVKFVVTNGTDAIEGATLTLGTVEFTTDANGEVTTSLVDGSYAYSVSMADFYTVTDTVIVAGAAVTENIALTAVPYYSVKFIVTNKNTNEVVENAVVSFLDTELTTDMAGEAEFTQISPTSDVDYTVTFGEVSATGKITVTDADVVENVVLNIVGVNDKNEITFAVYPNPASEFVTIKASSEILSITVYSLNGKIIQVIDNLDAAELKVNLSDYAQGIYNIHVKTEQSENVERVIVQ